MMRIASANGAKTAIATENAQHAKTLAMTTKAT
jgi:hypothetical protein